MPETMSMQRRTAVLAGLMLMLISGLWGCAAGSLGSLQPDAGVTRMFVQNSVPADYRNYVCGRTTMPYAIVGLDPAYAFDVALWKEVAPNTREFARRVAFVWDPHVWYQFVSGRGALIQGPDGNPIGIWYSMYPDATIRVDEKKRSVVIYCPHRISEDNF